MLIQKNDSDLTQVAKFLDSKFRGPFGLSFGWDGILSFLPGVGDFISSGFSFYIIFRASVLGCPPSVLMRMAINSAIESMLNLVPGLGILSDFVWKANIRNVQLVDDYMRNPRQTQVRSRFAVLFILLFVIVFSGFLIWCGAKLLQELYNYSQGSNLTFV